MKGHDNIQASFWDGASDKIANLEMTPFAVREIKDFFDFIGLDKKDGEKILEVGCGAGRFTLPLLRMGFQVTGTEVSARSLEQLRSIAKKERVADRLVLKCTSFKKLELEDEFDWVIFGNVIHHFDPEQKERIMENIIKSAKQGARVAVFEPSAYYPLYLPWYLFLDVSGREKGIWEAEKGIFKNTLRSLSTLLTHCGVNVIEVKRHTIIPLRVGKIFESVGKINETLEKIPIVRNLSAFIWIKAIKPKTQYI